MPVTGRPVLPTWKWLAGIVTLYGFLGCTRRALVAWVRRHNDTLYAANFANRPSVIERTTYCDLGHEADIAAFTASTLGRKPTLWWIAGAGGRGKTALAFEMVRQARQHSHDQLLPVLIDEDWPGALDGYVASLLRVDDRGPTPAMVATLGNAGPLIIIVDSLSERGVQEAIASVSEAVRRTVFRRMIVTSRTPCPAGMTWRDFHTIEARPLRRDRLPAYAKAYAPQVEFDTVLERIQPLLNNDQPLNPLFARFAIE